MHGGGICNSVHDVELPAQFCAPALCCEFHGLSICIYGVKSSLLEIMTSALSLWLWQATDQGGRSPSAKTSVTRRSCSSAMPRLARPTFWAGTSRERCQRSRRAAGRLTRSKFLAKRPQSGGHPLWKNWITCEKPWENLGKTLGKPWENLGRTSCI